MAYPFLLENITTACLEIFYFEEDFMKAKKISVTQTTSLENTLATKERYNPYQGGYGAHKTDKHRYLKCI